MLESAKFEETNSKNIKNRYQLISIKFLAKKSRWCKQNVIQWTMCFRDCQMTSLWTPLWPLPRTLQQMWTASYGMRRLLVWPVKSKKITIHFFKSFFLLILAPPNTITFNPLPLTQCPPNISASPESKSSLRSQQTILNTKKVEQILDRVWEWNVSVRMNSYDPLNKSLIFND